jgi:hypothetical protein
MMVNLGTADILEGELTQLLHGLIDGYAPLTNRIEHCFEIFLIHVCVPGAWVGCCRYNTPAVLFHAKPVLGDIAPSKKSSPVAFFQQLCYKFAYNFES